MAPLGNNINPSPHEDRGVISEPGYGLWNSTSCAEPYVDAKEGAAFLRIHPKTLMRLAREGGMPAYSFGEGSRRHWRFLISELDKWMKSKVNSSAHPVTSVSPGRRK
jgi:excisionase family DNA binding protein